MKIENKHSARKLTYSMFLNLNARKKFLSAKIKKKYRSANNHNVNSERTEIFENVNLHD